MKATVLSKIQRVTTALEIGVPPEKNENKCTYCMYKHECSLVDAGKWVNPKPPVKPQKASQSSKRARVDYTKKKNKVATGSKRASTKKIKEAIAKQEEAREAQLLHEADMGLIDARRGR